MRKLAFACGLIAMLAATAVTQAALMIDADNNPVSADATNQKVMLYVTGGDLVSGMNLYAQIGDGTGPKPVVTGIDMRTGTIFGLSGNQGGTGTWGPDFPLCFDATVTTGSGSVEANGKVATITLDTTGIPAGTSWPFYLSAGGVNTDFAGKPVTLVQGTIYTVPEPATLLLAASGLAAGGLFFRIRRKTAKQA
jgi:hypothetical protein